MAGDEPSEDAEAGSDADGGEDSASGEPADATGEESPPTDDRAEDDPASNDAAGDSDDPGKSGESGADDMGAAASGPDPGVPAAADEEPPEEDSHADSVSRDGRVGDGEAVEAGEQGEDEEAAEDGERRAPAGDESDANDEGDTQPADVDPDPAESAAGREETDGDTGRDGTDEGGSTDAHDADSDGDDEGAAGGDDEPDGASDYARDGDAEGSDAKDGDTEDSDAEGGDTTGERPDVEALPLSPDHETDAEVDPPVPSSAEDVDPDVDSDLGVEDRPEGVDEEPAGLAGPVADDADEPDASGRAFGGVRSGPAEDREMPLAEHIREMLQRLAVVVAVAGLVSLLVFPFSEIIINFLWYSILPGVESDIARPRLYGVLELVFTELKVASLAGLIVALPIMVYQTYAFMRPGLYPHERRYYLAAIPTSLVLALIGVSFAYFVVLPAIFTYFLYYSQDVATIGFALGRTFDLILLLMGYMAIVFQIPLFILLAMMMGLTSRQWLADRRLLFWGAFLGISFLFSPDPTGMAPIMVAATMIVLFEGTLLLTKWTGRG